MSAPPPSLPPQSRPTLKPDLTLELAGCSVYFRTTSSSDLFQGLIKFNFSCTFKMHIKELRCYFDTKVERIIKLMQSVHNIPIGSG